MVIRRNRVWNKKWYKQFKDENGNRVYEHRHVMEQKLGRKLMTDEVVHHINGDRTDNNINNLVVMKKSEHQVHHHTKYGKHCTIDDCKKPHLSKGLCSMHYRRLRVHGDPRKTTVVRYNHEVQKCSSEGCDDRIFCKFLCSKHFKKLMWKLSKRSTA